MNKELLLFIETYETFLKYQDVFSNDNGAVAEIAFEKEVSHES